MVQRRRSSSEDRPSAVRGSRSSSAAAAAPHIGNVRVTRIEHQQHQQHQSLAAPATSSTYRRSRSPSGAYHSLHGGGSVSDLASLTTTNHPHFYKPRSLSDIAVTSSTPRSRAAGQDAYVVGYATVKTHSRPAGSEGVNYKVFLNQVPTGPSSAYLTSELTTAKPSQPRFDQSSYSAYKPSPPSYYTSTSYSMTSPPATTYPSVSSSYSSSTRRSRAPTRSASLPRSLYTPPVTPSRSYTPTSPSSATLRMLASDGPAVTSWTPWKSARPAASRQHDEDEFYRRLREIRLRAASPVSDDLDLVHRRPSRGRTTGRPTVSFSPNVIYTGKKIDYGLIPERPPPPPLPPVLASHSTFVDDNPSRYHEFQPTDVGVVVLPNGQRAVTYTHQSQTGHGDHREANVQIEKIIQKTKHLQDSMHTLEEFVRRNRSLFPEDIIIYQNVKFFRLNEDELSRIGERPDAEVYGVKIREKLVVPYGTEVIDILRKHYSRHREVEIEYDDLEHIRHLAASAEKTQLSTKDSIRRVVEAEYDDVDRMRSKARSPAAVVPGADYRMMTLESLNAPVRMPPGVETETVRWQTLRPLTEGRRVDAVPAGEVTRPGLEFTSKLRNRHITEGNSVRLSCALNITPDTVITWQHNNHIVKESDNHHLSVSFPTFVFNVSYSRRHTGQLPPICRQLTTRDCEKCFQCTISLFFFSGAEALRCLTELIG